jgi:hypothetical protein
MRFEANNEVLQSSIIGHIVRSTPKYFDIERLNEVKHKAYFSTVQGTRDNVPIDAVGLTFDSNYNIVISERTEGHLMKLSLSGDLVQESNFRGEFKNSCGICINSKQEILVTDGKLDKIFRFNSNLKLLQIIGSYLGTKFGSLNFPW